MKKQGYINGANTNHAGERDGHSFTYKYSLHAKYVPVIVLNIRYAFFQISLTVVWMKDWSEGQERWQGDVRRLSRQSR